MRSNDLVVGPNGPNSGAQSSMRESAQVFVLSGELLARADEFEGVTVCFCARQSIAIVAPVSALDTVRGAPCRTRTCDLLVRRQQQVRYLVGSSGVRLGQDPAVTRCSASSCSQIVHSGMG